MLATFLQADPRKPEEQATAVLASALRTSHGLRNALLKRLEVKETGDVEIEAEQRTGEGREKVDLEVLVVGDTDRRELRRRVWIEVKVRDELEAAVAATEGRDARDPQLVRYRRALNAVDDRHGRVRPSPLAALLAGAPTAREKVQIEATNALVLYWQWIGDMAADRARELADEDWRTAARQPEASLELANLHTLVWFLEEAQARTSDGNRKDFVGINVTDPMTEEVVADYATAYRALRMVRALGERIALDLEDQDWSVEEYSEPEPEDEILDTLSYTILGTPPGAQDWWAPYGGAVEMDLAPMDDRKEIDGAVAWAGITFLDTNLAPRSSPEWVDRLAADGLVLYDDQDTTTLAYVGAVRPLSELISGEDKTRGQGEAVANWLHATLAAITRLGPPEA